MAFKENKVKDIYLLTTEVENLFINEIMPDAPSDYIKVYLYSLYAMKYEENITPYVVSKKLNMDIEMVDSAYRYFESYGLLKIEESLTDVYMYDVSFISQRERLYSNIKEKKEEKDSAYEGNLKVVLLGVEKIFARPLSVKEIDEISDWYNNLNASSDLIICAVDYCISRGKNNINYISKVVLSWVKKGLKTKEDVTEHLKNIDERQDAYKKILNSIGIYRNVTTAEKTLIDSWFDDMHFNMDRILDATNRTISTTNPNLRYVNKILENWASEAKLHNVDVNNTLDVTTKDVNDYLAYLRDKEEKEAVLRRNEVYKKIPYLKDLDIKLASSQREIALKTIKREDVKLLKEEVNKMEEERGTILKDNNYDINYTNIRYSCDLCRDTGIDENGARCSCFNKRFNETGLWKKQN